MTLNLSQFERLPLTRQTLAALRTHLESWRHWMKKCGEEVPELHILVLRHDLQIVPFEQAQRLLDAGWREVERY